ncbi:MAG: peptidoglycan-binding protein, partial [Clostridia bacterium]|nr:peptidoglycan-binding protein [Clostridia bacterium]
TRINRARLSLLVTFAYNAVGSGTTFNSARGVEVYYSPYNQFATRSRNLSERVYENVVDFTGRPGRFVGSLSVGVLSNVNCPSTLIEAGYMTNRDEAKLMLNPIFVNNVGEGACAGVCRYLGVNYVAREVQNYPILKVTNKGNNVKLLQYLLNEYGYNLSTDGSFGNGTLSAVKSFQRNNNLLVDGVVGRNTWSALLNLNPSSFTLRQGDRKSAVLFLQRLLLSYLYPITNLDGVFGTETLNAVKLFQSENGLTADGIVGPRTWNSLLNNIGRKIN